MLATIGSRKDTGVWNHCSQDGGGNKKAFLGEAVGQAESQGRVGMEAVVKPVLGIAMN